jgi:hypothetical protein
VQHLFLTHKRAKTCRRLTPAAATQPRFAGTACCMCDQQQHMLRCQILFSAAMAAVQQQKPFTPTPTASDFSVTTNLPSGVEYGAQAPHGSNPFQAAADAAKPAAAGSSRGSHTSRRAVMEEEALAGLTDEEKEVAVTPAMEFEHAAHKAAGGNATLGTMDAAQLEAWWGNGSKGPRGLLQANTTAGWW